VPGIGWRMHMSKIAAEIRPLSPVRAPRRWCHGKASTCRRLVRHGMDSADVSKRPRARGPSGEV